MVGLRFYCLKKQCVLCTNTEILNISISGKLPSSLLCIIILAWLWYMAAFQLWNVQWISKWIFYHFWVYTFQWVCMCYQHTRFVYTDSYVDLHSVLFTLLKITVVKIDLVHLRHSGPYLDLIVVTQFSVYFSKYVYITWDFINSQFT